MDIVNDITTVMSYDNLLYNTYPTFVEYPFLCSLFPQQVNVLVDECYDVINMFCKTSDNSAALPNQMHHKDQPLFGDQTSPFICVHGNSFIC